MSNKTNLILLCTLLSTIFLFNACKEPENIGLEYIKNDVKVVQSDTFNIKAFTIREDSIAKLSQYTILAYSLVGSYHDPEFGQIDASFCTQFSMTSPNINFGDNPVLDSIVLSLPYIKGYGYDSIPRTFHVYRVNQDITVETDFNPYQTISHENTDLANAFTFIPRFKDSVVIEDKKYAPMVRIPLSLDFGNNLLEQAASNVYNSNDNFQQFLKGLYIKSSINNGIGGMISFNLYHENASLNLYFHNNQSAKNVVSFVTKSNAKWRNIIAHDYSTASIALQQQLSGNYTTADSVLYVMGLNSNKLKIALPYIKNNPSLNNCVINNAELILPIENITVENILRFPPPQNVILDGLGEDNNYYSLSGIINRGTWNGTMRDYRINVTILIQYMLTNKWNHPYLVLRTAEGLRLNSAERVIFKGHKRPNGMRLKITYTKNQ